MSKVEPAHAAQMDQLGAELRVVAAVIGEFHASLLERGFEREEALCLVRDWLDVYLEVE